MVSSNNTLYQNIKQRRRALKFTQDKLARKADIPYTTLVKIETGTVKSPSVQTVHKIAQALGVTIDELIS